MTDLETAIAEAIGRAYARPENANKEMDYTLAKAISDETVAIVSGEMITREDSDAQAGALLQEAAGVVKANSGKRSIYKNDYLEILALSPDATAALDRAVKAAREEWQ